MGEDPGEVGAQRVGDEGAKTPEQLRAEIETDREQLGDTVEALAAKTDVKTRARDKADELKRTAVDKKDDLLSRTRRSKPADGGLSGTEQGGSGFSSAMEQLKATAQQNPVQTAAIGGFVGGLLAGKALARR
jgi:hypothetical protein